MSGHRPLRAALLLFALLAPPRGARACQCPILPSVAFWARADAVFEGVSLGVVHSGRSAASRADSAVSIRPAVDTVACAFRVTRRIKGLVPDTVRVWTNRASCGYLKMTGGGRHLMFCGSRDGQWWTSACTGSTPAEFAPPMLDSFSNLLGEGALEDRERRAAAFFLERSSDAGNPRRLEWLAYLGYLPTQAAASRRSLDSLWTRAGTQAREQLLATVARVAPDRAARVKFLLVELADSSQELRWSASGALAELWDAAGVDTSEVLAAIRVASARGEGPVVVFDLAQLGPRARPALGILRRLSAGPMPPPLRNSIRQALTEIE